MADHYSVPIGSLANLEAEAALLGALMIDNRVVDQVSEILAVADFAEPLYGRIYEAVLQLTTAGQTANPVTLRPRFEHDPAVLELGGPGYLATLTSSGIGLLAADSFARQIIELARRRRLIAKLENVTRQASDPSIQIGDALADIAAAALSIELADLAVVRMAELAGQAVPQARWIVPGWLPVGATTLLAGGGGTGKSLFVQGLLTAISLGQSYLGLEPTEAMPALFVNCEDSADEMHRRSTSICTALDCFPRELTDMFCLSRAGAMGNELGTFGEDGRFRVSVFFRQIASVAKHNRVRVVALDNIGHMFTGNENDRAEVTQFVNLSTQLAMEIDGAVILLGHPAKIHGSQFSGSTAWENAVRTRWYLERPDANNTDLPDRRVLKLGKANGAAIGKTIEMAWNNGAFVRPDAIPVDNNGRLSVEHAAIEDRFLKCLDLCTAQERHVSDRPKAGNYAPKFFARMPEGKGIRESQYAAAMEWLLRQDRIVLHATLGWKDSGRRHAIGIARTEWDGGL